MILHTKGEDFRDAVQSAAEGLGINEIFIEKDYWVTYILKNLSHSRFREDIVFKGGTSLSKAFGLIKRFSEDIDLALLKKENMSSHQIREKIRKVEKTLVTEPLRENENYGASKGSNIRKTGYSYPRKLESYDGFRRTVIKDIIILELNAFTNPVPWQRKSIETYIARYLRGFDESLIRQYGLESFEVKVLGTEKTFVEKLLCLSSLSIDNDGYYAGLKDKIRHFYDIYMLLETPEIKKFVKSPKFEETLRSVLDNDLSHPEFKSRWTESSLERTPLFSKIDNVFSSIGRGFNDELKTLLYSDENISLHEVKASFVDLSKNIPQIEITPNGVL